MSCQRKGMGGSTGCKRLQKKEDYRQAKLKFPNIDNPLENWECDEVCEKSCPRFKPVPPRMTKEEFGKQQEELLKDLPEEFKGFVSYKAWEEGHAEGFENIICILSDLVSDLKDNIVMFEQRIRKEVLNTYKNRLD